jgi:excisionase family DNA binding protein
MNELPNLMKVSELREYLHLNTATAYELVKQRSFPSIKIGNKYLVNADKLPE